MPCMLCINQFEIFKNAVQHFAKDLKILNVSCNIARRI